jgi:hypothetical protein
LSQGAAELFEPIPASKNRNARRMAAKIIQKAFIIKLWKWPLTAAKANKVAVTKTSPVICHA